MELLSLETELKNNAYPGRGIVVGKSSDEKNAVIAYFIMGRSTNSRNRIFVEDGNGLRTKAYDESKLEDPSLIIYAPVRVWKDYTIVTNGDQTDTVYDGLDAKKSFKTALESRMFEPDAPNFTPRISALLHVTGGSFSYEMSILKSDAGRENACVRYTFSYDAPPAGEGRFLHTYKCDGEPIPSFEGEPKPVIIDKDIDDFSRVLWESLNADNKVSLFVRYIDLQTGEYTQRIMNKNSGQ